jgi:hypothetical protein
MTRTVKYTILAIVAIPLLAVAAVLALLGTFSIAHSYKIGWVEAPVHYKLTFGVELGGRRLAGRPAKSSISYRTRDMRLSLKTGGGFPTVGLSSRRDIYRLRTEITPKTK